MSNIMKINKQPYFIIGKLMYLISLAELAIYSFFRGDIGMTRPTKFPFLEGYTQILAIVSGIILLISVLFILAKRYTTAAVFTIASTIFLMTTSRHIGNQWLDAVNGFKSLWLIGGALLLLVDNEKYRKNIILYNVIVVSVFFYHCGIAHFQFADFVKGLIPDFIPFPLFFTYFAGICLLLAAIGLFTAQYRSLAALLSGIQTVGWCLLLHIPRALTLKGDEWIGVGESLAVSGICFMLYSVFDNKKERLLEEV
jgi:hypothetical protein